MEAQPFPRSVAGLLAAADRLPPGQARLEVLQRAVRVADSLRMSPRGSGSVGG